MSMTCFSRDPFSVATVQFATEMLLRRMQREGTTVEMEPAVSPAENN